MNPILNSIIAFVPLISAITDKVEPDAIARYGLLGAVLAWFMLKADKRLAGIEHKIVGVNRTMLIEILSRPTSTDRGRKEARRELIRLAPDLAEEFPEQ